MKTLDFIANLKLNVEGNSTKLDEMIKNLETLKDSSGEIFGVGNETAGKAKQLQERMQEEQKIINDPKATDEAKAAAIKEQNRSMQEYYKLINTVLNREITGLASKSEKAKELLENHKKINEEYQKENQNLDKVIEKMDELSSKTGQYNESVNRLKNEGLLDGVTDTMDAKQIEDKKKELKDTPENKDKRDALEEHLKVVNELKKEGITTEKELADANIKARQEAQTQAEIVDKTRTKKADLLDKVIEQLKAEGKISDETGEILKDTSKILDKEEKITTQKRKRKSIKESKDATGDLGVPKDEGKPKKDTLLQKVTSATLYFAALRALRKMITSVISTVRELDKSITEVAMVTNMNRQQTWKLVGAYQALAQEVGTTTSEIARLSVFFFRQGRTVSDAMELTKVAAIAARVASIDAVKSANFLTSAINGFGMAASQAMAVSDRFAALGASSASSYEEMAIALSKVAPVAKVAGVGIDFMMAALAKGIETTREAPENIGTAFKTIFARMTQIRDFGTTLEDGIGVNTVERALKLAGVQLRDSSGNFRNMEQVLIELGYAFEGLDRNQQSYIATALAGTRQQSRLLAVMQNFGRTMELVDVSLNSSGATLAQHEIYSSGLEASMLRLQNAFQGVTLAFSNSEFVIKFIDRLAKVLGEVAENIKNNEKAFKIFASIAVPLIVIALGAIKIAALQAAGALTAATFGLNIILPAVVALVGVGLHKYFQATKTEAQKLAEASKEVSEEIKKTQVAMYNLEKSKTQISTLVKRFKELDGQVIKTAEELAEMDDITQRLKEIGKTEYNILLTGKIDEDGQRILKIIEEDLKKAQTKELELGMEKLKDFASGVVEVNELEASDMQAAVRALSEIMFGKSFLEASVDEQKQMQEIALNNFEKYVEDYKDIIVEKEKADDRYVRSTNAITQAESMYASSVKPTAGKYIGNFFGNIGRGIGRLLFGGDKQHITPAQLQEQMQEAGKVINDDNLSKLRTTGASGGLRNLFASNNAMLEAAAAAQNVTIDEILTKDMDFVIEGIQKHAQVVQDAFEAEIEKINANAPEKLDKKILGMRESFVKLFQGKIDPKDQKELLDQFFGLDKNSQEALAKSVADLQYVYQLGIENLKEVISNTMTSTGGALVTASQKINIVSILRRAGLNKTQITSFFKDTSEFTADSIASFLNSIKSSFDKGVKDVDFQNLAQDLYGVLSGGMDSQKLYQTVQKQKSSASLILDLQEKFRNNMLTAEEYQMVSERLAGTGMMEEFMNGTLTAVKYMEESVNILTNSIDSTIKGVEGQMKTAAEAGKDITSFQEELLLLNHMRDNIEQLIFTQTMDDYYQSQIDYIKQINKELQEEIDLEQRKIDMNRSMLALNRQIMALERDTSYGAQARREELEFTRDKQVAEQNKFIIETVSNQKISELQSQMSEKMASFAQRTALSTEGIYSYLTTGTTSAKTFTTYSGVGVRGRDNKFFTLEPQ